jgi:hypothetical protein
MEKEFVPYEQALELKELGFDEPCFGLYHNDKTFYPTQCKSHKQFHGQICLALLYQQAFSWFREKHNLWSMVYPREGWNYSIQRIDENITCTQESFHSIEINTYKETELACLNRLIEIVKEKI